MTDAPETVPEASRAAVAEPTREAMADPEAVTVQDPVTAPDAVTAVAEPERPAPVADLAAPPAADTHGRRRTLTAVLGGVLALAVVGGVGYTAVTVHGADRTTATTLYRPGKARPAPETAPGALGRTLLPVPLGYRPGPDIEGRGNDVTYNAEEAVSVMKEPGRNAPVARREAKYRAIDRLRVKGLAMRSYSRPGTPPEMESGWETDFDPGYDTVTSLVVQTTITQVGNRSALASLSTASGLLEAAAGGRDGPEVEGHPHAHCYLSPQAEDGTLPGMMCTAYQGDLFLTSTAYGAAPLDTEAVVELFADQLDRVTGSGVSV